MYSIQMKSLVPGFADLDFAIADQIHDPSEEHASRHAGCDAPSEMTLLHTQFETNGS